MYRSIALLLLALLGTTAIRAQQPAATLTTTLQHIADTAGVQAGVAIIEAEGGNSYSIGNSHHYPMQSTYKFPLALYILHLVDEGKLKLDEPIYIPASTLDSTTWSPMLKDHPDQGFFSLSIQELLAYSVGLSDNNACDILFAQAGGTGAVHKYIQGLGIKDMAIAATEREMHQADSVQYTNWCTPMAMAQLLQRFHEGKLLSKASTTLLLDMMTHTPSGPGRIKGMLPPGTVVAHKTGTSGTNGAGITAATNDVGIITLPNGRHIMLAVYLTNYKGGTTRGEWVIATMARAVYNHFNTQ